MSSVSRWVYTNVATVWKAGKKDHMNGGSVWGEPFQIDCTWTATNKSATEPGGKEFVSMCEYFHEDKRVGFGDRIKKGFHSAPNPISLGGTDVIRSHVDWDMSFFGEKDSPDFKSIT